MALVFTRRIGEVVCIGNDTRITILNVRKRHNRTPPAVQLRHSDENGIISESLYKEGAELVICENVTVYVGEIKNERGRVPQIRIAVNAPRAISVDRLEIRQKRNSGIPYTSKKKVGKEGRKILSRKK